MYLGTRSASAAAPDLEAAEAELAAGADGVVATEPPGGHSAEGEHSTQDVGAGLGSNVGSAVGS